MADGWNYPQDLLEAAWGLLANADWDRDPEWTAAVERWRDAYHETLSLPVPEGDK